MIDSILSVTLGLMMFTIGASLTFLEFKKLFKSPKAVVLGLILQMIALPTLALLITSFSNLPPELKMGIFVVSICPGGTTSNFISYIAKTDVALSISLTSINSFIILITIPLFVDFGFDYYQLGDHGYTLDLSSTLSYVLTVVILPVFLGIIFNEKYSRFSLSIRSILKYLNIGLLCLVFGIKIFGSESNGGSGVTSTAIIQLLPYCLLLNLLSMLGSYMISLWSGLNNYQSTTVGIEVGLQNTALALLITAIIINSNKMSQPALVFAMFTFFTALIFALSAKKYGKNKNMGV